MPREGGEDRAHQTHAARESVLDRRCGQLARQRSLDLLSNLDVPERSIGVREDTEHRIVNEAEATDRAFDAQRRSRMSRARSLAQPVELSNDIRVRRMRDEVY